MHEFQFRILLSFHIWNQSKIMYQSIIEQLVKCICLFRFLFCSEEENDEDNASADNDNEENMDTSEPAESRTRNPNDEYNFADYDNEGTSIINMHMNGYLQ